MNRMARENISKHAKTLAFACFFVFVFSFIPAQAQTQTTPAQGSNVFELYVRAANSTMLVFDGGNINLWGVEPVSGMSPTFNLKARTVLANAVSGGKVECEIKSRKGRDIWAQCVNKNDLDLGLYMIQQGYVVVNRGSVFDSVFEDAYVQAEIEAQDRGLGVWAESQGEQGSSSDGDGSLMIVLGFVLFLCIVGAFMALSVIIMRGFKQVIEAQNNNMDMIAKERQLREKERSVVAVMLDSELKANKSKIEAYLLVYEEMLDNLRDFEALPKYKKAGDIVQMQPVLSREVFDRNTDKLETLGAKLSSGLIHFYARVKTNPDYENLNPETPLDEAIATVEKAVKSAQRLNKICNDLIEVFERSGVMKART